MKRMWSKNELRKIIQETYGIDINNLIDKDGHERFPEGDIDLQDSVPEGISKIYGKWALSGTHLLIVLAVNVENTTTFAGTIAQINLPKWIKDKIVPLFSNGVDLKSFTAFAENLSTQTISAYLRKVSENVVDIYVNSFIASADRNVRITFDLLIDNA